MRLDIWHVGGRDVLLAGGVMRPVRLSVGRLMIAVAIIAVALGIIQIDSHSFEVFRYWHEYVIGVVPMGSILLFVHLTCLRDLVRRGRCHSSLVGFEVFGWSVLFAYTSFLAVNYGEGATRTLDWLRPVTDFFYPHGCKYASIEVMGLHMVVLFLPMFFLSLAGGFLCGRLGISVIRGAPGASGD
jgi:hypothetical protein